MKEPYIEGLATHDDPESCVRVRKGTSEALTGACAGWLLSREITTLGCRRRASRRKAISPAALVRAADGPRAVEDPMHAQNLSAREPGDHMAILTVKVGADRTGKVKAVIL